MKTVFIVDYVTDYPEVEQYGNTCNTHEEAMKVFAEAVHAYNMDDYWDGVAGVCQCEQECIKLLVIREISLPA